MRTTNQPFKQLLLPLIFSVIFTNNSLALAETSESADKTAHHETHSNDWPGLYHGFTPCADCMGIKTTLALNTNKTYILMTQNVGKSIREFVEKGKFTWGEKANTIMLTARKSDAIRYYLVGDKTLTQLNEHGEPFTGKDAERNILRRVDVANTPQEHSGH